MPTILRTCTLHRGISVTGVLSGLLVFVVRITLTKLALMLLVQTTGLQVGVQMCRECMENLPTLSCTAISLYVEMIIRAPDIFHAETLP